MTLLSQLLRAHDIISLIFIPERVRSTNRLNTLEDQMPIPVMGLKVLLLVALITQPILHEGYHFHWSMSFCHLPLKSSFLFASLMVRALKSEV